MDILTRYITKTVPFTFRGIDFRFALSQGLFSSADIDAGTRLLLKAWSRLLDEDNAAGRPLPRRILDSGCGCGVIGVCAARAIAAPGGAVLVRAQDRDELARLLTLRNAEQNRVPPPALEAYAEPLLAGPPGSRWDLILTNIPAKAGRPVLADFVRRSTGLLAAGGRVVMVAVHTLAGFFREQIAAAGAELEREETGPGHCVLVYRPANGPAGPQLPAAPAAAGPGLLDRCPFYVRTAAACVVEDIPLRIQTVHGAAGFDAPGGAETAAAKLIRRLGPEKLFPRRITPDGSAIAHNGGAAAILIHEPGQGFFPCWLLEFLRRQLPAARLPPLVLSGRNVLALEAARHNAASAAAGQHPAGGGDWPAPLIVPAVDLSLGAAALRTAAGPQGAGGFGLIAVFPELLPQSSLPKGTDQLAAWWNSLPPLLPPGGICVAGFSSVDAERFDRKKPAGFTRLGGVKRDGFRALGYMLRTRLSGYD